LILREWNIWHCYSTYLLSPIADLRKAADGLVRSGLCELAFLTDGSVCWREENVTVHDRLSIKRTPYEARANVKFPTSLKSFALECAYQAAWMDVEETHVFSDPLANLPTYLRAYLTRCKLTYKDREVNLYPQIKLYGTGVLLVEFRVLSGDFPYDIDRFIDEQINLFKHAASAVSIPPSLLQQYARASWLGNRGTLRSRSATLSLLKALDTWISSHTILEENGEFIFPTISLDDIGFEELQDVEASSTNLRFLAQMIQYAVAQVLFPARKGLPYIIAGPDNNGFPMGGFWSGRPSVYIISFVDQPTRSTEIVSEFKNALSSVMLRTVAEPSTTKLEKTLPDDLRAFEDYSVFINKALTLWVCAGTAFSQRNNELNDPNHGQFIYDKHVQSEFVEYLYMSHRLLEERSLQPQRAIEAVVGEQQQIALLERTLTDASPFGEILDLVRYADACLGLDRLRLQIRENLRLKTFVLEERRDLNARRFGWLLSVLLGIAGLPSIANSVVIPLLNVLGLSLPGTPQLQTLYAVGMSAVILVVPIWLVWRLTAGRRSAAQTRIKFGMNG